MESWPKPKAPAAEKEPATLGSMDTVETKEDFIKAVDFNTLNDIFDQLAVRSGGPENQFGSGHRVIPENVRFYEKNEAMEAGLSGEAFASTGDIDLTWEEADPKGISTRNVFLLSTLVHEAAHIRAGFKKTYHYQNEEAREYGSQRSGYHQAHEKDQGYSEQGFSLNEAVTETLTLEVLDEYLRRTGNTKYLDDPNLVHDISGHLYLKDRVALAVVVRALARELELPRDDVWKAFVQGYMAGNLDLDRLSWDMRGVLVSNRIASDLGEVLIHSDSDVQSRVWDRREIDTLLEGVPEFEERVALMRQVMEGFGRENIEHALGLR